MYTQCPACHTAFRVTARVLQQAGGRVRCGGCSSAFNALEFLSEELPAARDTAPAGDAPRADNARKKLLETLDKLAGPENVIIEDTGVEWQVLGGTEGRKTAGGTQGDDTASVRWTIENEKDVGAAAKALPEIVSKVPLQGAAAERRTTADSVMRFDDNTPLPEDYDEVVTVTPAAPQRRAQDKVQIEKAHFDEKQFDLALGSPDEWVNLLDEVDEADATGSTPLSLEVEEELAAIHNELTARPAPRSTDASARNGSSGATQDDAPIASEEDEHPESPQAADETLQDTGEFEKDIETARLALLAEEPDASTGAAAAEEVTLSLAEEPAEGSGNGIEASDEDIAELVLKGEIETAAAPPAGKKSERPRKRRDSKSKRAAEKQREEEPAKPRYPDHLFDENADNVETIIMEGEFVHGSLREQEAAAREASTRLDETAFLADTYSINRNKLRGGKRRSDPAGPGVKAAVAVLALLLVAQLMHNMRQTLSTVGAFNQTVAPVYRLLGQPITPQWDVKGWQFESTNNAIDDSGRLLTICSTVTNRSSSALPYPLVHISLTDRWEEILGSQMLDPKDYLGVVPDFCVGAPSAALDPSLPVAAGEKFTAVMRIVLPSMEATGFKLNVCYRVDPQRARCATEDFKE